MRFMKQRGRGAVGVLVLIDETCVAAAAFCDGQYVARERAIAEGHALRRML